MPTYRTLFRNEADELAAHYLRLAPDDRTLRFFGKVSDEFIRLHCQQIDWLRTTIVGCVIDGCAGPLNCTLTRFLLGKAKSPSPSSRHFSVRASAPN